MHVFNKGLKGRLLLWSFFQCALLISLSIMMNWGLSVLNENLDKLGHERLPKAVFLVEMRMNENAIVRYLWTAFEESNTEARKKRSIK